MTHPRGGRAARSLLVAVALLLALASCASDDQGPVRTETRTPPPTEPSPAGAQGDQGGGDADLDLVEAAAVAVAAVDGSSLLNIETEPGRTVWEATVVTRDGTEHEMLISAKDGEVIDGPARKIDDAEDKSENRRLVAGAEIGYSQAATIIQEAVPGVRLTELNLDMFRRDRAVSWEGDLHGSTNVRWKVKIDARTGDLLEKDTDADDDD